MKTRTLLFALVFPLFPPCLLAQYAPLDRAEILGRLAVRYSPSYVAHLVKTRGVSFSPGGDFLYRVKLAGGDGILVERLSSIDSPSAISSTNSERPVAHLAKCAELIHTGALESAESECRASVQENPESPWPLLVVAKFVQDSEGDSPNSGKEKNAEHAELLRRAASLAPNLAAVRQALASTLPPSGASSELQNANALDLEHLDASEVRDWRGRPNRFAFAYADDDPSATSPAPGTSITVAPEILRRIKIDPDLASNHLALAQYSLQARDFDKAHSEILEAIRLEPDNPEIRIGLAMLYLSRHNLDAALAELHEGVRIAPFGMFQHMALAGTLEILGRTPEAIAELHTIIAVHPADLEPSGALVELYLEHKDRASAIAELRRTLQVSSLAFADQTRFVDARLHDLDRLALLLKENRELDAAAQQFLFLLRFKPDDPNIHNDYGNVLLDQRRLDEAIGEYNEALRLNPGMSTAHHNIGMCLRLKKDFDGAIAEFRRALELNPDEPHTHVFLGTALGQKGDLKAAMEQFQQAIEKNPMDPEAHMSVAYAFDQLKNPAGTIHELKLYLELQPDSPDAENNLAWIYATADDPKFRNTAEALVLARRAVEKSQHSNPAFLDTLAEALLLNGHPAEALTTEVQALKLDPENPELQDRLTHFRQAADRPTSSKP